MTTASGSKRIYFVLGEESGDTLGAELLLAFRSMEVDVQHLGLAGPRMQALGASSLFDIGDLSVMGISAVLARLPTILNRIRRTADDIVAQRPDAVILIDSPDFCHRVARRIRRHLPGIPIVKYVCPSVWAWRSGRARKMTRTIDHVLALLPFEPAVLRQLGGPPATYVGHPLSARLGDLQLPDRSIPSHDRTVLILPGSRRSEIRQLLPDMERTLEIMAQRGTRFRALLPAVPRLEDEIRAAVAQWQVKPEIVTGEAAKHQAFLEADVALAASGTVLLELALYRVPTLSIYRLDWLMRRIRFLITAWTGALPNLIADSAFLPERVDDMVRPAWLARAIEALLEPGAARDAQLQGFARMAERMRLETAPNLVAAKAILDVMAAGRRQAE